MKRQTKISLFTLISLLLCLALPVAALAQVYDLADGSVIVTAKEDGKRYVTQIGGVTNEEQYSDTVIEQSGGVTGNTVTILAETGQTAEITLGGVDIDCSALDRVAAVYTGGAGDVVIELDGVNTLQSGANRAGLEKDNDGTLTINDADNDGVLNAFGGDYGAGIGGGDSDYYNGDGSGIIINGGTVNATGGGTAAGIGGGRDGAGSHITVNGGAVNATGGFDGAGIGGGWYGDGSDITVNGGIVNALGGNFAAGIGGGYCGDGSGITVNGGTVNATGGYGGAGIGGGNRCSGSGITVNGGTVTASGGSHGAGIGGGLYGSGSDVTVSGVARVNVQGGGGDPDIGAGAGIGNGGNYLSSSTPIDGAEIDPDVSALMTAGWIRYYAPGADMDTAEPVRIITGVVIPPAPSPSPRTYAVGDREVTLSAPLWVIVEIEEDIVTLVSVDAFTAGELEDLETLIKTLLEKEQLEKLLPDENGERVFPAGGDILKDYFDGEAGHITVRVEKDALEEGLVFDAAGVLSPARIAGLVPDPVSPVYFCFDKESLLSPWPRLS
ncbi:MAG: hypothetical protein ACOX17_01740 [Christensenellales bacterium]|jgi:hypothetical protein